MMTVLKAIARALCVVSVVAWSGAARSEDDGPVKIGVLADMRAFMRTLAARARLKPSRWQSKTLAATCSESQSK
jgi:hypothetical protein